MSVYRRRNTDDRFRVLSRSDNGVTLVRLDPDGHDTGAPWTVTDIHFNCLYRPDETEPC